ncbi:MAG: MgtC/SapB family protein [Anaerolineales bacterium]
MAWTNDFTLLSKILIAVILGGIIGYERESAHEPAGLRTHMLVAAAAMLIVGLGEGLANTFQTSERTTTDPLRLIEAVIVGVSFLGAGTILHRERDMRVEGLTTAASLLFTAGLGIAMAVNKIVLAVGALIIILLITGGLGYLMSKMNKGVS